MVYGRRRRALRRVKPDSLLSVDVPPGHWVEEEVLGREESFCPDESLCSGEVLSPDRARFRGESLFPAEGQFQGEAHSPSQTRLADEAPRDDIGCAAPWWLWKLPRRWSS